MALAEERPCEAVDLTLLVLDERPEWIPEHRVGALTYSATCALACARSRAGEAQAGEESRLRFLALEFMTRELDAWQAQASASPENEGFIQAAYRTYLNDDAFLPVRDAALDLLPAEEHIEWQAFWERIRAGVR
jgi:hypothetical protein